MSSGAYITFPGRNCNTTRSPMAEEVFRMSPALALLAVLAIPGAGLAAQGLSLPPWVQPDSTAHAVELALEMRGGGPEGIATINGFHHGDHELVVPLGWTVRWTWVNRDSTAHSLVLMAEREKLPAQGGAPALENALTRSVLQGVKPGQQDRTSFVANQAGWYWLLCGVAAHAIRGEWIRFRVDGAARLPEVRGS